MNNIWLEKYISITNTPSTTRDVDAPRVVVVVIVNSIWLRTPFSLVDVLMQNNTRTHLRYVDNSTLPASFWIGNIAPVPAAAIGSKTL